MISQSPIVYLIPGLGVDERIFKFLKLKTAQVKCLKWLDPFHSESLKSYCERLLKQIDTEREIILVGVSFGGLVAQEIASLIPCKKVVIISSIKSTKEFSLELRLARLTKINRIFSPQILKWLNGLTANYYFGIKSIEDAQLLHEIIKDTDDNFLKWAIECIMKWENKEPLPQIVHLHGSKDRIFPANYIKEAQFINGGHFMVVDKSEEVSEFLNPHLL